MMEGSAAQGVVLQVLNEKIFGVNKERGLRVHFIKNELPDLLPLEILLIFNKFLSVGLLIEVYIKKNYQRGKEQKRPKEPVFRLQVRNKS